MFTATGSLRMVARGGMIIDGRPPNVTGLPEPATMVASLSRTGHVRGSNHQRLRTVNVRERHAGLRAANARPDDLPDRLIVQGGHRGRGGRLTCRRRRRAWHSAAVESPAAPVRPSPTCLPSGHRWSGPAPEARAAQRGERQRQSPHAALCLNDSFASSQTRSHGQFLPPARDRLMKGKGANDGRERARQAYGLNCARLAAIKATWTVAAHRRAAPTTGGKARPSDAVPEGHRCDCDARHLIGRLWTLRFGRKY